MAVSGYFTPPRWKICHSGVPQMTVSGCFTPPYGNLAILGSPDDSLRPTGNINWNTILPGVTTMEVMHLLTPNQVQLTQAVHLFITTQGRPTVEGTALGDDDQTPQARPAQAVLVNATAKTDIAVDPHPEWTAVHYTLDSAKDDPVLTDWRTQRATEVSRLNDVTLDDTLTPQTMELAGRTARTLGGAPKHTLWHYPTTIHPEAVTQSKKALSLTLQDTHTAHQPGMLQHTRTSQQTPAMYPRSPNQHCHPPSRRCPRQPKPWRTGRLPHRTGRPTSSSTNAPTTTLTKHSRQGAKYTHQCPWMVHFVL